MDTINKCIARYIDSPSEVVEAIRVMIEDKVVCDIGCRVGVFMGCLQKYAKHVIGIEKKEELYKLAKKSGYDVILGDASTIRLPKADVYYIWVHVNQFLPIIKNIKTGHIVLGTLSLDDFKHIEMLKEFHKLGGFTLNIPALNYDNILGNFNLTIIRKNELKKYR